MSMMRKKFEGKIYRHIHTIVGKQEAERVAKKTREDEFLARVVPTPGRKGHYDIYARKRE